MARFRTTAMLLLAIPLATGAVSQSPNHLNALEPSTKTELTLPTDVIAGNCLLKAGTYIVQCDREIVTFTLKTTKEKMAEFACQGPMMKEKAKETRADLVKQPSGYLALERLYLKGNNVEHVF